MHGGRTVYIVDGVRTPFLKARGKPGPFSATELAVTAGHTLLNRQPFDNKAIDEVILGCVSPDADEMNIGRIAALRLGLSDKTQAWTVARNCASGMQSIDSGATNIALGRSDLVLAGGTEAMSRAPILFQREFAAWLGQWSQAKSFGAKLKTLSKLSPRTLAPVIGLIKGLTDPVCGLNMGQTAEKIAYRFGITRKQMDEFAVRSHIRLAEAIDNGIFDHEITPLFDSNGNHYQYDDGLRRDSNVEKLATLRPVFDKPAGLVTAANSAQITDGCAWVLLASAEAVGKYQLNILGEIQDSHWAGLDPTEMGLGPVHASTPILKRNKLNLNDVYWEINEAFAGQVLACLKAWESDDYCRDMLGVDGALGTLEQSQLNIHGGGVSMGHPVGTSGARIVLHALNVLRNRDWQQAIASLCIGGGQGGAMLIKRHDNHSNHVNRTGNNHE